MIDNTNLLSTLINQKTIRINWSDIFQTTPAALPNDFDITRIEGMLLGVAIGDSLGATSEGKKPDERHKLYGEITNYLSERHSNYKPIGTPTDDTQLTFWTLKQLINDNGLVPDNLANRFCKHHIIGIGHATSAFVNNYKDKHLPWYRSGENRLGNGALMRISSVIIPYIRQPHSSMFVDAALDTMITHNAYANTAACVAYTYILWSLLSMKYAPEPKWWLDTFCSIAKKLEGNTIYCPRMPQYANYKGSLWKFTEHVITDALSRNLSVLDACNEWGSGADIFETVPSVLYILAKHSHNAEEAIIRAVNDTVDNDTIAAIVGAAVGALHGLHAIPERWITALSGRTRSSDDSEVFKLILLAKNKFWYR